MLVLVRINKILLIRTGIYMGGKYERDYTARHEKILKKIMEIEAQGDSACFPISRIATELKMDQRTVRAHLKIIEIHNLGAFMDPEEKQFCTKGGITLLAKKLGVEKAVNKLAN